MKNVFKRCLSLIVLFEKNSEGINSNFIKDNIEQYRNLSESAFHRSFERDKEILRTLGYIIEFNNDKWGFATGYKISGTEIWQGLKKTLGANSYEFLTTFLYLKNIFTTSNSIQNTIEDKKLTILRQAIDRKSRVSFLYNNEKKKVYPYCFRLYKNCWYLGALDKDVQKTYKISKIDQIKIGSIDNLHTHTLESMPPRFTWEEDTNPVKVLMSLSKNSYILYKDIFVHKLISYKEIKQGIEIIVSTYDMEGLKSFLILISQYCTKIEVKNHENKKELIDALKR
jgi:predicted DNA-binding transcriptional regulator YafY|tara:strand:+ start:506 stop:1354 length:849 start_codon:yes stop_codon:yes gene_type:complete